MNTVISLSSSYGTKLGLDTTGMILALLVTQVVAVPCSILFGKLAERAGSLRMIRIAIAVYFVVCLVGFYMGWNIEVNGGQEAIQLSQNPVLDYGFPGGHGTGRHSGYFPLLFRKTGAPQPLYGILRLL